MIPDIDRPVDFLMTYGAGVTPVDTPPEVIGFGPRGPAGIGSDKHYVQEFTNLDTIFVQHNLGKYPAVTVTTSAGDEVILDIDHIDTNSLFVYSVGSFSGRVTCN